MESLFNKTAALRSVTLLQRHFSTGVFIPWLHGLKATYEQQKEPDYLINKTLSKIFNYFWNACKELLEKKKINIQCSLSDGVSFLIGRQLCQKWNSGTVVFL